MVFCEVCRIFRCLVTNPLDQIAKSPQLFFFAGLVVPWQNPRIKRRDHVNCKSLESPRHRKLSEFPPIRNKAVRIGLDLVAKLMAERDLASALDLVSRLLTLQPLNPELYFVQASLHQRLGDNSSAAEFYAKVLAALPRHVPSLVGRAACLIALDRLLDAWDAI